MRPDRVALARDPTDDEQQHDDGDRDDGEQGECGAAGPADTVSFEPRDRR